MRFDTRAATNNSFSHYGFPGNALNGAISPALVTMQIQALRESLLRLEDLSDSPRIELPDKEPEDIDSILYLLKNWKQL